VSSIVFAVILVVFAVLSIIQKKTYRIIKYFGLVAFLLALAAFALVLTDGIGESEDAIGSLISNVIANIFGGSARLVASSLVLYIVSIVTLPRKDKKAKKAKKIKEAVAK
jgi:hypothetical protein